MKKLLIIAVLLLAPSVVNAEECTTEMINSYLLAANSVYMNHESTANPDTYKIYVYGLTTGLSYSGINGTRFSDGYYAFATAGDIFTISIKAADGSACALREIKTLSLYLPGKTVESQPVITEPVNEPDSPTSNENPKPKPPINNNVITDEGAKPEPVLPDDSTSEETIKENLDDQTSIDKPETVEKESIANDNIKNNNIDYTKYSLLIFISVVSIFSLIYIYFKKNKGHK